MLQNGTVISGTMIEKPHSFSTACNIATQIIAQVASNQYGGQSISLAHRHRLWMFREKIRKEVIGEQELVGMEYPEDVLNEIVERRLKKEITKGVRDNRISGDHTDDNKWTGTVPYSFHVFERGKEREREERPGDDYRRDTSSALSGS